jgi:cell division protein FtsW (lipid II flippase)
MRTHGVPSSRLLIQVVACILGLGLFALVRRVRINEKWNTWFTLLTIAFLATSFLGHGEQGVYRWVSLGGVQLHAAAIACPILLVAFVRSSFAAGFEAPARLGALALLAAQPDAGQTTALGITLLVLCWQRSTGMTALLHTLSYLLMITIAWSLPDGLKPIIEVEGIVDLAFAQGTWLGGLALATLALPIATLFAAPARPLGPCLATYLLVSFIVTRLAHFPVPLLGYGAAPILGTLITFGAIAHQEAS